MLKYFKVDNNTTLGEIEKQHKELAKKHHPDVGGDTKIMQDIGIEYMLAKERIRRYELFRDADQAGKILLNGLVDYIIDKLPSNVLPRFVNKGMIKNSPLKKKLIDKANASDIITGIEEYIKNRKIKNQ